MNDAEWMAIRDRIAAVRQSEEEHAVRAVETNDCRESGPELTWTFWFAVVAVVATVWLAATLTVLR